MPVVDNTFYDLVPQPNFGSDFKSSNKEISFESEGGYEHTRDAWPNRRKTFDLKWTRVTQGVINTILEWLELKRRDAFWFVDPTSLAPRPDGSIVPELYYVRVKGDDFKHTPIAFDGEQTRHNCSLTFREV